MAQPSLFGAQVGQAHRVRGRLERDALDDLDAVPAESFDLGGVVREEPRAPHPEPTQHRGGGGPVASVDGKAKGDVGVDRVEAVVLERIRPHLVEEPDPPSLVTEVQEHATVGATKKLERALELLPAVTAQRAERLAGQAFGVQAHEDRGPRAHVPLHQRDDFGLVARHAIDGNAERAEAGRQCRLRPVRRGGIEAAGGHRTMPEQAADRAARITRHHLASEPLAPLLHCPSAGGR